MSEPWEGSITPSLLSKIWAGLEPQNLAGEMADQGLTSELRTLDTLKDPWAWGGEPLEPFLPLGME